MLSMSLFLGLSLTVALLPVCLCNPLRACDNKPVNGCTCFSRFGRTMVSCSSLGLTTFPVLPLLNPSASLTKLYLDMSANKIQEMGEAVLDGVQLVTLVMSANRPARGDVNIRTGAFLSQRMSLDTLIMSASNLREIPVALFELESLATLDLSYNNITVITTDFQNFRRLRSLRLDGNPLRRIKQSAFSNSPHLFTLSLTFRRKVKRKPVDSWFPCSDLASSLTSLTFKDTDLGRHTLLTNLLSAQCLPNIQHFECNACNLDAVHVNFITPNNGGNFLSIKLPHNRLDGSVLTGLTVHPENPGQTLVPNLQRLDLSHNRITEMQFSDPFLSVFLPSLTSLDISNKRFTSVPLGVYTLPELRHLDVRNNSVTTFDLETVGWERKHMKVLVDGNPLLCDCANAWMVEMVARQAAQEEGWPFLLYEAHTLTCDAPTLSRGKRLAQMYIDQLCCQNKEDASFYARRCENRPYYSICQEKYWPYFNSTCVSYEPN